MILWLGQLQFGIDTHDWEWLGAVCKFLGEG